MTTTIFKMIPHQNHGAQTRKLTLLFGLILLLPLFGACQQAGKSNAKGDHADVLAGDIKIPQEPNYIRGVLDNGLKYSIRSNDRIAGRMVMYLGLTAGSLQEEDDQRGLAHFLEHMAFNGSEHFPGNSLIDFARENGMSFGAHINAHTSFTETVYNFVLPTNNEPLLDKGLLVLADWLNGLTIEPKEVENERGVVLSEWRGSLGFGERYRDTLFSLLFEGSKYGERLPIGLAQVIENAPPQRLRDFYQKWYNTGNAMVVVVGDFDAQAMQRRIEKQLGSIPAPHTASDGSPGAVTAEILSNGVNRDWGTDVPLREVTRAVQMRDDEAPSRGVSILIKTPRTAVPTTVGELRKRLAFKMLHLIAQQRFSDVMKQESGIVASLDGFNLESIGNVDLYSFSVGGQKGHLKEGYAILLQAMAQLKKYGVLQSEMDLAANVLRSDIEVEYNEREKRDNNSLAKAEIDEFLGAHLNSDIAWIYQNLEGIIAGINLQDLNDMVNVVLQSGDVSIIAVSRDQDDLSEEAELVRNYQALDQLEVKPPQEQVLPEQLLQTMPVAGKIVAEDHLPQTGFDRWTLNNGIEVYFKRTDFGQSQFEYSAQRLGGLLALDDKFGPSRTALGSLLDGVVSPSGFAGLSPEEYERYMSALKVGNSWEFGLVTTALKGISDIVDAEELFQQIYLSFTEPQFSEKLVKQGLESLRTSYDNMMADPNQHFMNLVKQDWYQNDDRILLPPPEKLPTYTAAQLQEIFRKLVPSAQGFRFVFVGNIDEGQLKDYVKQYIASLPTGQISDQVTGRGAKDLILYSDGGFKEMAIGPENTALTMTIWDSFIEPQRFPDEQNYRLVAEARLLSALLEIRVNKVLREELAKTYSPQASVSFEVVPRNRMTTFFYYTSAPEDVAELDVTSDRIIAEIQHGEIQELEFKDVKEQLLKGLEDALQQNSYWKDTLQDALLFGYKDIDNTLSQTQLQEVVKSISIQELADFAAKYIPHERKMRYTMLPKKN